MITKVVKGNSMYHIPAEMPVALSGTGIDILLKSGHQNKGLKYRDEKNISNLI